jgi:hypothetical protein
MKQCGSCGANLNDTASFCSHVAAAIFDFSKKPIKFKDGVGKTTLAYTISQYWRPFDEIEVANSDVIFQPGEQGHGAAAKNVGDALSGTNVRDSDIERYAQIALKWQTSHDGSRAVDFLDVYTTQISSKKKGMAVGGKTWALRDIEQEFINTRLNYNKAILIWADDYSHYRQHGNDADYCVTLSGESFSDKDAGTGWCTSNGFGPGDCIPAKTAAYRD